MHLRRLSVLEDITVKYRRLVLSLLVPICLFIAFGCTRREIPPKIGERSPRIELYDLKDNRVALPDDLKNKIVIIRFWEDCCSYNINEMSRVGQIYRKYEGKGIRIVTIHTGGTRKVAEHFVPMLNIKYPVLLDPDSKTAKRYGVSELPCTFILDRDGVIKAKIVGPVEGPVGPTYEKVVLPLLN
jgi:peroxiredoxin